MTYALKKNCQNIDDNKRKINKLEKEFIRLLKEAREIEFIKNGGKNTLSGNISLSFKNQDGEAMLHRLDLKGICVSTGSACDSYNTNISHVLQAIRLNKEYAKGTIRISLGKDNTMEEIKIVAEEIIKIVQI